MLDRRKDKDGVKMESLDSYNDIFGLILQDVKVGRKKNVVKLHSSYVAGSTGASERMVIRQTLCQNYGLKVNAPDGPNESEWTRETKGRGSRKAGGKKSASATQRKGKNRKT